MHCLRAGLLCRTAEFFANGRPGWERRGQELQARRVQKAARLIKRARATTSSFLLIRSPGASTLGGPLDEPGLCLMAAESDSV